MTDAGSSTASTVLTEHSPAPEAAPQTREAAQEPVQPVAHVSICVADTPQQQLSVQFGDQSPVPLTCQYKALRQRMDACARQVWTANEDPRLGAGGGHTDGDTDGDTDVNTEGDVNAGVGVPEIDAYFRQIQAGRTLHSVVASVTMPDTAHEVFASHTERQHIVNGYLEDGVLLGLAPPSGFVDSCRRSDDAAHQQDSNSADHGSASVGVTSSTGSSTGSSASSITGSSTGSSASSITGSSTDSSTGSSTSSSTGSSNGSSTDSSTGSSNGSSTGSSTGTAARNCPRDRVLVALEDAQDTWGVPCVPPAVLEAAMAHAPCTRWRLPCVRYTLQPDADSVRLGRWVGCGNDTEGPQCVISVQWVTATLHWMHMLALHPAAHARPCTADQLAAHAAEFMRGESPAPHALPAAHAEAMAARHFFTRLQDTRIALTAASTVALTTSLREVIMRIANSYAVLEAVYGTSALRELCNRALAGHRVAEVYAEVDTMYCCCVSSGVCIDVVPLVDPATFLQLVRSVRQNASRDASHAKSTDKPNGKGGSGKDSSGKGSSGKGRAVGKGHAAGKGHTAGTSGDTDKEWEVMSNGVPCVYCGTQCAKRRVVSSSRLAGDAAVSTAQCAEAAAAGTGAVGVSAVVGSKLSTWQMCPVAKTRAATLGAKDACVASDPFLLALMQLNTTNATGGRLQRQHVAMMDHFLLGVASSAAAMGSGATSTLNLAHAVRAQVCYGPSAVLENAGMDAAWLYVPVSRWLALPLGRCVPAHALVLKWLYPAASRLQGAQTVKVLLPMGMPLRALYSREGVREAAAATAIDAVVAETEMATEAGRAGRGGSRDRIMATRAVLETLAKEPSQSVYAAARHILACALPCNPCAVPELAQAVHTGRGSANVAIVHVYAHVAWWYGSEACQ